MASDRRISDIIERRRAAKAKSQRKWRRRSAQGIIVGNAPCDHIIADALVSEHFIAEADLKDKDKLGEAMSGLLKYLWLHR